jgi:3-hydroxybutyrate dehydrogenase
MRSVHRMCAPCLSKSSSLTRRVYTGFQSPRSWRKSWVSEGAIGRLLEPEEVAQLVTYLCTDTVSGITNSVPTIDCGWMAH